MASPTTPDGSTNGAWVWVGSAAAGATLTRGNSHTVLATLSLQDDAKWGGHNELQLGADAAYGKSTIDNVSSETADSLHGFAQYNWLFTQRLYGYARLDALHDAIADIAYRVTFAPGAGYYFIKTKATQLSAEAGPGAVVEKLGGQQENYFTLRLADTFRQELSDRARIWQTAEVLPQVDKFDNYLVNFELGLEADLVKNKKFTVRTFVDDNYDNRPAAGRLKNDLKWITAVAYKF